MVNDWTSVLREMDKFLDEVDTLMSDNNMLQTKLFTWRIILGSWRKNLVDDGEKIRTTLRAVKQQETTELQTIGNFNPSFNELLNHVESLKDRTERTFGALMSSMAIAESQRAISQAESISRLTELAFLFIPLSFATSLFGMQLQVSTSPKTLGRGFILFQKINLSLIKQNARAGVKTTGHFSSSYWQSVSLPDPTGFASSSAVESVNT